MLKLVGGVLAGGVGVGGGVVVGAVGGLVSREAGI